MSVYDVSLLNSVVLDGAILDLSPMSRTLCLMALGAVNKRYLWSNNGSPLDDIEWDTLDGDISLAMDEIMGSMVGMIIQSVWNTASVFKFIPCDGGVYNKADYPLLYDVIDSQFIISGTQFTVPDLRNKFPVGAGGAYAVGDTGGSTEHTLSLSEIPTHSHSYGYPSVGIDIEGAGVPDVTAVSNPPSPIQTSAVGGGLPHNNLPPYYAIEFYIIAG